MAAFTVGTGFFADFDKIPLATASGDIVVADSHLIRIKTKTGFENFVGNFEYNAQGLPLGTILEYFFGSGGQRVYTIANANIDVLELRHTAASGDPEDFLKLIFRGDDILLGAGLDDKMAGYDGNDTLKGRGGDDVLKGLAGRDAIQGGAGNDVLLGGLDRDVLNGGTGDDWLNGGGDRNALIGGTGDDTFVFRAVGKPNTIRDFAEGDRIGLGLSGLGPSGALDPAAFHVGTKAVNPAQKILYDIDNGWLLFAQHGSATLHPEKFAKIYRDLDHLGADDFFVL